MPGPQIVLLVPLGDLAGGTPGQLPIFPGAGAPGHLPAPGGGAPGHLPAPGEPGHPSHPISPGAGGAPDQGLPVPPEVWPNPPQPLPPELATQVVVAVHRPGHDWVVKSYPAVGPGQGLPGGPGMPAPGPHS
jgi:hypothetical protein